MNADVRDRLAMNSPLSNDIQWLNARLDEVETGAAQSVLDRLRTLTPAMLQTGQPDALLQELGAADIHAVLKLLTIRFHLRNKAEQVHIVRVNRNREWSATPEAPRPESLAEAIGKLARDGVSLTSLLQTIASLDISPTLTAHPTESRRRSVIRKQARVADLLQANNIESATPAERRFAESSLRQTLALLLATDEVRSKRLEVIDEVRNGIHYLAGTIWDAAPGLYHDLSGAIETYYGEDPPLPVFLRYRTWIGGDGDGNPNVTAELTRRALAEMRDAAIARHTEALEQLRRDLSISGKRVPIDERLLDSIRKDDEERLIDPQLTRHLQHEPFRVKLRHMLVRLGDVEYTSERFCADLKTLQRALQHAGLEEAARRGPLADSVIRAETFGFHLAALDVRQDSRVHERVVAELLHLSGVYANYAELDESARRDVLRRELQTARPLLARGAKLSAQSAQVLETLHALATAIAQEPDSVGSYIVSMAHDVSDLLEVLILLREAGLWTITEGRASCPLDVVPLFETVDDLDRAAGTMRALFAEPAYAGQLAGRNNFQEIMLGYSDSNKDGGYWAANWRLQCAQDQLAQACRQAEVSFRFFHGRGGTVARGGGRAHRAILASPPASRNGRIRFTEQGEVISFRYAMPALAHRHLEQITNAMILATAKKGTAESPADDVNAAEMQPLMDRLASHSRTAYRDLIDSPDFWPLYVERSPVLHIGELPIASRPVSRSGGEIRFGNLRAIPWVFAWTQMRYNTPGWFGIGGAFKEAVLSDEARLAMCQGAYSSSGSFRAFIDNAQQEMARARLAVGRWYLDDDGADLHQRLEEEFNRTEQAVLAITGQDQLLDNNPVIQQSIRERNPDTDVINALQVELLRRWRNAQSNQNGDADKWHALILLSVNALAAAMQSTG
ncbi:MAG: phosphoenolpyruvate carboxylase [Pirellulales bacterium]|nr:phosphoenolpyruvate carboxylase [Pirellulales bacterium]